MNKCLPEWSSENSVDIFGKYMISALRGYAIFRLQPSERGDIVQNTRLVESLFFAKSASVDLIERPLVIVTLTVH